MYGFVRPKKSTPTNGWPKDKHPPPFCPNSPKSPKRLNCPNNPNRYWGAERQRQAPQEPQQRRSNQHEHQTQSRCHWALHTHNGEMSAEKGWIGEPQPPKEWHESHLHSPCPVCGQPTRFKQYGPFGCLCNEGKEAREARRRYQEGTYDGQHQRSQSM